MTSAAPANGFAHNLGIAEKILGLFRGRQDVLAVPNGDDFMPERLSQPLTAERLARQHLGQHGCLGVYLMMPENDVLASCVDFDNKPKNPDPLWKEKAAKVYSYLEGAGLSPLLEISQSGNASHVWLFFDEPIDAWIVRQFWAGISQRLNVQFVEVYPRQDFLEEGGVGNLIRYPLWNQSRFVDPVDWSTIEPDEALDGVKPIGPDELLSICRSLKFKIERPAPSAGIELDGATAEGGLSKRVVELLNKPSKLKDRWDGNTEGLGDASRSGLVESIACLMIRAFVPTGEIVAALRHWCQASGYEKGLRDDWIKRTVEHAYEFIGGKADDAREAAERPHRFRIYSSAELDDLEFNDQAIIENAKIEGQPGGVFGGTKTLKTCIVGDACVSVASATNFLGCDFFRVPRPRRVLFMSSESGVKAMQRLARRISQARGYELSELTNLLWSDAVPFIGDDRDPREIRQIIQDRGIEWVAFDPLYQMLDGREANNLYAQGVQFRRLQEACREAGADFDLLHHNSRASARLLDPPTLNDAQWSGIAEFVGQWWLLGRRERYLPGSGIHRLWLESGARGDFQNSWALDVNEHADQHGRPQGWSVSVRPAAEAQGGGDGSDQATKQDQKFEQLVETAMKKIVHAAIKFPDGETAATIRARAGLDGKIHVKEAFARLLNDGAMEECGVIKGGRKTPREGYRLTREESDQ